MTTTGFAAHQTVPPAEIIASSQTLAHFLSLSTLIPQISHTEANNPLSSLRPFIQANPSEDIRTLAISRAQQYQQPRYVTQRNQITHLPNTIHTTAIMAPAAWDDEDSESTPPSSPPVVAARRGKFDDEEDDEDVLESWDAAEDSEVEREKEKKAAEAKAKAEAEAKANHKSKSQRIEEKRQAAMRKKMEEDMEEDSEEEDEAEKRARLREEEKLSDLANAEDMFGNIGISKNRSAPKAVTVTEGDDPASAVDLSAMKLFKPANPAEWRKLNETLTGLLTANAKKPQYAIFMQDFAKQLVKDLNSDQVRKIATGLSTMSNEKMKEEKAAEKGGKKSKAAKTKPSVVAQKDVGSRADTAAYDDGLEE
jgi:translation initiation factor 3 subunit J